MGGRGCGGRGAERSGLPRKGRVPQSEAAGWACARYPQPGLGRSRARAGARAGPGSAGEGQRPELGSQAVSGRERRARGLRSPEPRCEAVAPRPERAPWGPRSLWRWAPSTTWHFSCNSEAPRGPPATRPGTTTSPATVSSVAPPRTSPPNPTPGCAAPTWPSPGLEPSRALAGVPWRPLPGPWTRPGTPATPAEEGAPRVQPRSHREPPTPQHARADTHTSRTTQVFAARGTLTVLTFTTPALTHLQTPSQIPLLTHKHSHLCRLHTHTGTTVGGLTPCQLAPRHTHSAQLLPAFLPADTHTHL